MEFANLTTAAGDGNEVSCTNGIVCYKICTYVDAEEAARLSMTGKSYLENGQAQCVLIDLLHPNKSPLTFSSSARKVWVQFLQNDNIEKTALLGNSVFMKTLAMFVIAATGKKNIRFFTSEEEAIRWLKDQKRVD
ncbi:MAG: SpoIIAA family protein [Minisyncoccota bacterium]